MKRYMKWNVWILLVGIFMLTSASEKSFAEQTANSFEQLRARVKAGDKIAVTGVDGKTIKGIVQEVSTETLNMKVDGANRTLSQLEVRKIEQVRHFSGLAGAGIGAGVGFLIGLGSLSSPTEELEELQVPFFAGIGAGIGAVVAAFIPHNKTLFRNSGGTSQLRFKPILKGQNKGVGVSLSF